MRLQAAVLLDLSIHHVDALDGGVQRVRVLSEGRLDHRVPRMTGRVDWRISDDEERGLV